MISFITSDAASLLTGSDVLADGGMVSVLPPSWDGKLPRPVGLIEEDNQWSIWTSRI